MHYELLRDLVLVMGTSLISVILLGRLKVPTLVGFLAAGIVIGPGGFGLVKEMHSVEQLAEIGVVFLLFTIGLQFSVSDLLNLKRYVLLGGSLQMGATIAVVTVAGLAFAMSAREATYLGAMVAMSSTAILLRLLTERGEVGAPHGRFDLGVAIFQDLAVIPLILFLPLWAGTGADTGSALVTLGRTAGLLLALFIAARFLFPWFLERIVRTKSREAFTLATLLGALGTAWLCSQMGVSLSLGAFLAGIVLADSAYAHQVLSEVTPLKDALSSLFFASVGMFVDPMLWVREPALSLGLVAATIVIKVLVAAGAARLLGLSRRAALLGGVGLAQIGEFSFVMAILGGAKEVGLFPDAYRPQFFSVAVLSMAATPFLLRLASAWCDRRGMKLVEAVRPAAGGGAAAAGHDGDGHAGGGHGAGLGVEDHVIVVGYGVSGRNVTRVLQRHHVHHVVLEMNPATVRRLKGEVEHIQYGDATQEETLRHAGVSDARVLVVAIPDPAAARQIVAVSRKLRPDLVILVRTRLVAEVEPLRRLGAQDVVAEEFETSLELAGRVLSAYGVSDRVVAREKGSIRRERYGMLLDGAPLPPPGDDLDALLGELDVATLVVGAGSKAAGRSLREIDLRRETGVTVLVMSREGRTTANPDPDAGLAAGDLLTVLGTQEQLGAARGLLE